ncbi:hypothetical protein ACIPY0_14890 [Paenarthrobacter nicotinovorans]|uniref:hypothetical protein n=1 Tax=Paenarthrobacter nicotinovorans TaxID=29320 RepID=UPI00382BD0F1
MRVAKTDIIAGLPAPVARSLVRLFRGRPAGRRLADRLLHDNDVDDLDAVFSAMEVAGYLERIGENDGHIWWEATTSGNALAMASFGKPISRKTADRLVTGLADRARAYNADPGKPLFIDKLRIFGSYLQPDVDPLGDVDVELAYGWRSYGPKAITDYAKASGKYFSDVMDEIFWPEKELLQHLRNRSVALNITVEDIDLLTVESAVVYTIDDDANALPPPQERRLVGRN